jgi:pyruvate,water dikinase
MEVDVTLVEPEISTFPLPQTKKKRRTAVKGSTGYIVNLFDKKLPATIGNKAQSLRLLMEQKFLVPETHICTWDAHMDYNEKKDQVLKQIEEELGQVVDPKSSFAVRSSANMEDSLDYSFAGQFETLLNVQGVDNIIKAIQTIWSNIKSETVQSYFKKIQKNPEGLKMAVIIQKMVDPVLSGVVFSKNPINALDEVLVEAVEGSGTALVQGGVTPLRWINKWGGWIEKPENDKVSLAVIQEVVDRTKTIKRFVGEEVDLEWVYDGKDIYWLQVRNITSLERMNVYSSRMAKEMTPGMIKPLVWSVVVPIPSQIWADMIQEAVGKIDLEPSNLAKSFHFRTYHNLSEFGKVFGKLGMPAESLEMMMGVIPPGAGKAPFKPSPRVIRLLPRILRLLRNRWTFAKKLEKKYALLHDRAMQFSLEPSQELDERHLIEMIDEINKLNLEMTYYTINAILLMQIYTGIMKSRLKKTGIDFTSFDLTEGMDELKLYDPNTYLEALSQSFLQLDIEKQSQIRESDFKAFMQVKDIEDFQQNVKKFIDRFGHMSDTTGHFGSIPWRETPEMVLDLIASHQTAQSQKEKKARWNDLKSAGKAGKFLKLLYKRSRQFSFFREKYSSLYTYSLMLFRVYYLAIGDRMVKQGLLHSRDDIYFLFDDEIRAFIAGEKRGDDFEELVRRRKEQMDFCKEAVLPEIIFGDVIPPVIRKTEDKLKGTPTSKGYFTGKVKVIHGIKEFPKMEKGDVLVIPYSDVSWTPLFTKAGAVISESGGMLSHSSIIAREYNIPAVVSTKGSLQLQDGTQVTVDGYKGEVLIHQNPISKPNRTDVGG